MEQPTSVPPPAAVQRDENTWAMLSHAAALIGFIIPFGNIIGPLVIWMMKKDQFALVDDQGKEAVNFQISMTIYYVIAAVLILILIGIVLLIVLGLFSLIMTIVAMVKANSGERYRYPVTIRLVK
jgi:hypothetical protein